MKATMIFWVIIVMTIGFCIGLYTNRPKQTDNEDQAIAKGCLSMTMILWLIGLAILIYIPAMLDDDINFPPLFP